MKLYFTPSVNVQTIARESEELVGFLGKETGLSFRTGIPTSYVAVVEAFGSGRADVALMNTFGYILAHDRHGAKARLGVVRRGLPHYFGQIIARADSGIETVKDIHGKRFAFTDPASTSGYMLPLKMLKDAGAEPAQTVFATKHDNVVTMVYQGQVDAGGTFHSPPDGTGRIRDARNLVRTQFPDVEEKVRVVRLTDPIPNEPLVFGKDVPDDMARAIASGLKKFLDSQEGRRTMEALYDIDGFVDVTDSDYDGLRAMVKSLEIDTARFL